MEKKITEITLNKNTCLEELTYAWCESECDLDKSRGVSFCKATRKGEKSIWFNEYVAAGSCDYGGENVYKEAIATFYFHNQQLLVQNKEKFAPILKDLKYVEDDKIPEETLNRRLIDACAEGDFKVIKEALRQGADINFSRNGLLASTIAFLYGHKKLERFLKKYRNLKNRQYRRTIM